MGTSVMQLWKDVRPRFVKTLTIGLLLGIAGSSPPSLAAVWNIQPDGSGDAPTIQAAVDAAVDGDVIRLWPGEYQEGVWVFQKSLAIESAKGPGTAFIREEGSLIQETDWTRIENLDFAGNNRSQGLFINDVVNTTIQGCSYSNHVLPLWIVRSNVEIDDCVFRSNVASFEHHPGALHLVKCPSQITNCVFEGNSSQFGQPGGIGGGGALFVDSASTDRHIITGNLFLENTAPNGGAAWISGIVEFFRNTVVFNESQSGAVVIHAERGSEIYSNVFAWNDPFGLWVSDGIGLSGGQCWCNAFWENNGWFGDILSHGTGWWGLCLGPGDPNDTDFDDINLDPEFCSREFHNFGLADTSPLLPQNHPPDAGSCTTTIGAFDEDCITNPVIRLTWGRVKSRYE